MYLYNVTLNVEDSVHDSWLQWMQETHIPKMLATGKFTGARICRVLVQEETGGITYAVQYGVKNMEVLQSYYDEEADKLREEGQRLFGEQVVAFRTELEVLGEQTITQVPATERLFAYGTLMDKDTQIAVFRRIIKGKADTLKGFRLLKHGVADKYPVIVRSEDSNEKVEGLILDLTHEELLQSDKYEGDAYRREKVSLESGAQAWVYMENVH